ncbi:MobA/MobL family protein [Escherichia coli]
MEIALPRELTPEQRLNWCRICTSGSRRTARLEFAIHNPKASIDGGEQPHAHIMMSQRVNDGIDRTPEQYSGAITPGIPSGEVRKGSGNLTLTQQKSS